MKKHLILISIGLPFQHLHDRGNFWASHGHYIKEHQELGEAVQKLAENVWLIERKKGLPFLKDLLAWGSANDNPYPISIRFLDEDCDAD